MRIAVSSCLLGNRVRYDGQHKADDFVLSQLAQFCDYQPLCPEDKAFGTPRPTIHVEYDSHSTNNRLSVIENVEKRDVTAPLFDAIENYIGALSDSDISGVILKSKSPSCGYGSTPRFRQGEYYDTANGLFAETLLLAFPELPIIEETGFIDDWQREQFLLHLFTYADMQQHKEEITVLDELRLFHTKHHLLLELKNAKLASELTEIVSNPNSNDLSNILAEYMALFKTAIARTMTREEYVKMLSTIVNEYSVADNDLKNTVEMIAQFKIGQVALCSVTTSLKESLVDSQSILHKSSLLNPYPEALATRTT